MPAMAPGERAVDEVELPLAELPGGFVEVAGEFAAPAVSVAAEVPVETAVAVVLAEPGVAPPTCVIYRIG